MPQAALPDLNTAFIIYRREAINALKGQRYDACFGALYAINGLLPKEYRVNVSTKLYNEKISLEIMAVCNHCKDKVNYKEIKIYDLLSPLIVGLITGSESEKVWNCTKCGKSNKLSKTDIIEPVLQEPNFTKMMPKPPERKNGLLDRVSFHREISRWVWTMIVELEAQMSNYRREYQPRDNEMIDSDLNMEETGEELDLSAS
jgi:hypothetical protein